MAKLNYKEISALCLMMERAIKHEQLRVTVESGGAEMTRFGTADLFGTCDAEDAAELILNAKALKWLWVRYQGSTGGKKKAANVKKLRRAS
jgi:hypothetical protein